VPESNPAAEARRWQLLIAAIFVGLGGWCLVAPMSVVDLTVRPEVRNDLPLTAITIGAFGAQAMLVGLVAATSRFTATTFLALGLAMLPFFVFDWWYYAVRPMFNELILLDAFGNIAMLGACARGWWLLRA
jgi:hypothetical protein